MNVFTYGSLMFPSVWEKVTGSRAAGGPARLAGFSARRIRGQSYPALVAEEGSVVEGVVYENVSQAAVKRLDDFEGSFYRRLEVEVEVKVEAGVEVIETLPARRILSAGVYVAANAEDPVILPEAWDAVEFERKFLAEFLAEDPGFTGGERRPG